MAPASSKTIMVIFIGLIIAISAIGITLKYRTLVGQQQVYPIQQSGYFSGCLSSMLWGIYLLGFFVLIIGLSHLAKTYYDYLSLDLLMTTLFIVWLFTMSGILLAELIAPAPIFYYESRKERLFFMSLFNFFSLIWVSLIFFIMLPNAVETYQGILSGPQWKSGIVERKSSGFNRLGTTYYININEEHKHMPDAKWWTSLEKGDEIQYAYNPHATDVSDIFRPNQITLTIPGIMLIIIGLALWFLTVRWAWEGFVNSIWPKEAARVVSPSVRQKLDEPLDTTGVEPSYKTSSEQTFPAILLIGLGMVAGIFLLFRKLRQLRGNSDNLRNQG